MGYLLFIYSLNPIHNRIYKYDNIYDILTVIISIIYMYCYLIMNNSVFSCSFCITTVSGAEENGRPGDSDSDISMFACRHTINLCIVWYIYV